MFIRNVFTIIFSVYLQNVAESPAPDHPNVEEIVVETVEEIEVDVIAIEIVTESEESVVGAKKVLVVAGMCLILLSHFI